MDQKKIHTNPPTEAQARALLAAIVESSDDAIISKTLDGIVTSWNAAAEKLYGYTAQEVLGRSISLLVPPERLDELLQIMARVSRGERVKHQETVRLAKGGRQVHVSVTLSPLQVLDGTISGVSTIARDIGERLQMEQQLRESEKRYSTLVEMAPDAVVVHRDGRLVYANCAALGMYGATSVLEMQQTSLLDLVHPGERDSAADRIRQLMEGKELPLREYRLRRLNGEEVSVEVSSILIDFQGRPAIQSIVRDISERKRAESEREGVLKELAFERSRFETVVRQMPLGVMVAEAPSGKLIFDNEKSRDIFRQEESSAQSIDDYGHWKIYRLDGSPLPIPEYPMARALRGESSFGEELQIGRGDGTRGFVSVHSLPIRDLAGEIDSAMVAFYDITETKAAAKALADSEERLNLALEAAGMGSCDIDLQSGQGIWSRRYFQLLGYDAPETGAGPATMEMWQNLIHPDDLEQVIGALKEARREHLLFRSEHRILRADNGQLLWVNVMGRFVCDQAGAACRFMGLIFDVTERREIEEKLQASEAKFRWLYESNLIAIYFWDADGLVTEANQAFCDLVGYSSLECREGGMRLLDVTPSEYFVKDLAAFEEIEARGICQPYQKMFINRTDGRRVPVLIVGARMVDGGVYGMGFAVDLTELKRTEDALKKSAATLKLAIETTGLGIFDLDLKTGKGGWSDIAKRHYGLPPDAVLDLEGVLSGVHPEDRGIVEGIVRDAAKRDGAGVYRAEYRTVEAGTGRVRWLSMRAKVALDAQGAPARLVGACLDITDIVNAEKALQVEVTEKLSAVEELRKQEQLLIRQGRLAAMGEMIGNIAHQWRQPLNTLGLIVQELPRYYERNLFDKEYLDASVTRAMQVINYMSKTIDGFRNFFGPDREREPFKAGEVLAKTVSIVEAAFSELSLKIEVAADQEIIVNGCPNEFSQVILNILVNAKDALVERQVAHPRVKVSLFREAGKAVLTIADNAGGIPPEILDSIFDPYFTTKGPDKGTGIGLFMSKTIIEKNMNGTLNVRNTGEGAEFRIEI